MTDFRVGAAAALLGVSDDMVRRWSEVGRLPLRTEHGRSVIDDGELASLATASVIATNVVIEIPGETT